ncbi:hypothetical protein SBV1_740039 [Verrucomicrobia bacterium]|nr:hypothetical protein SBV1_740039 [Verrucomicrobiota bacterium]
MARALRIEYPGAIYHVMARGNQGQKIYADDGDRKLWLSTLGQAWRRTGWPIHAFVLMGNHYHLLLETPEANLVSGMKWLQGTYTQRYNARHRKRGHREEKTLGRACWREPRKCHRASGPSPMREEPGGRTIWRKPGAWYRLGWVGWGWSRRIWRRLPKGK